MYRRRVAGLVALPLVVGGLFLLLRNGHLELAAWLLVLAVLATLALAGVALRRGHRRSAALLIGGALAAAATVGWYGWNLNVKLDNIPRLDDSVLNRGPRPPAPAGPTKAVNILLLGADNPLSTVDKPSIAELLADGEWDPGAYRSDTIMVLHVPADRHSAYVVSIPRDSYVEIYDEAGVPQGRNKVNYAFSIFGPFGTWRTVENLTDLRLDHTAIVDFEGFRDLTTALGGVDVYVPESVYDSKQDQQWDRGWVHLEDDLALKYVRMRYGLLEGDFDRVARQQNFLRAVMTRMLDDDVIANPVTLTRTLEVITRNLTIDRSWTNGDLRGLAFSMRGLDAQRVRFVTLPFDRYATVPGVGSVNIVNESRAAQLWRAVADDRLAQYLQENPGDELGDPRQVS